ncbi:MAG: FAD-binding oxidoreductase [Pseudomonadota bacterium]
MSQSVVDGLTRELSAQLRGNVLASEEDRAKYSKDESIFRIVPRVIVAPRDERDVQSTVEIAGHFRVPLTARGGGTSVAGQAIGPGIVLDFTRYMNGILDVSGDHVIVQPGVVLDHVNSVLAQKGRRIAPDPSSRASCTVGGMVGNNASGPHAFKHGDTRCHVARLRAVLADGTALESDEMPERFQTLTEEIRKSGSEIRAAQPETAKNSSGYALASLLSKRPDYTGLVVGSEGTLALVSEITLRTIPVPAVTSTVVFAFESMEDALAAVPALRSSRPAAIELVDQYILHALAGLDAGISDRLALGTAEASLWVEWEGQAPDITLSSHAVTLKGSQEQEHLWHLRSRASKALQEAGGSRRPLRCIEDGVVPAPHLGAYVAELREILLRHDCDGAVFGHAGDAHIHVNPMVNLRAAHLPRRLESLMEDAYSLLLRLGGSIAGEHGDGLLRGKFAGRQWSGLGHLFKAVRAAFDPHGLLNPDKKTFAAPDFGRLLREDLLEPPAPICLRSNPVTTS